MLFPANSPYSISAPVVECGEHVAARDVAYERGDFCDVDAGSMHVPLLNR
jgi:hypothetical protein